MGEIKIYKAEGTWVVRAGGAILGESKSALELIKPNHPPAIYFPREDIAMAFLEKSDHSTRCPNMGEASYFSIITKSQVLKDVAWSYEAPNHAAERIKGHLAFDPDDAVTIERL